MSRQSGIADSPSARRRPSASLQAASLADAYIVYAFPAARSSIRARRALARFESAMPFIEKGAVH